MNRYRETLFYNRKKPENLEPISFYCREPERKNVRAAGRVFKRLGVRILLPVASERFANQLCGGGGVRSFKV